MDNMAREQFTRLEVDCTTWFGYEEGGVRNHASEPWRKCQNTPLGTKLKWGLKPLQFSSAKHYEKYSDAHIIDRGWKEVGEEEWFSEK